MQMIDFELCVIEALVENQHVCRTADQTHKTCDDAV
jgi:hypothetical protein